MNDTQFLKEIGGRIKNVRLSKKMSQQALADLCEMDDTSICMIENGRANFHILNLKHIAEVLKVDLKNLITLKHGKG